MSDYTSEDLARLIARYTEDFRKQYPTPVQISAPVTQTVVQPAQSAESKESELTDIGSLQVRVSTENQAIPIVGASVLVTRNEGDRRLLVRSMITDENGTTELIDLPAKDRALSLSPENVSPFATYNVDVTADGYYRKRFVDLPIYGGVTAIQSVSMIPLPEAAGDENALVYPQVETTP